jgi:thymidylate synthase (FAD)
MKLVKPSFEIKSIMAEDDPLNLIESCGRICYKSEKKITDESAKLFVQKLNKLGHHSVLEHSAMTVKFVCDREVSHELVRHRLCAFSQESTRYCNYKDEVTFIIPPWVNIKPGTYEPQQPSNLKDPRSNVWYLAMLDAEDSYIYLIARSWSPQQARSVLPNSLKTEIAVTTNFRNWQHIFHLRCSKASHPQMRELIIPLLEECKKLIPVIFDDITY